MKVEEILKSFLAKSVDLSDANIEFNNNELMYKSIRGYNQRKIKVSPLFDRFGNIISIYIDDHKQELTRDLLEYFDVYNKTIYSLEYIEGVKVLNIDNTLTVSSSSANQELNDVSRSNQYISLISDYRFEMGYPTDDCLFHYKSRRQ